MQVSVYMHLLAVLFAADYNECSEGSHDCSVYAQCHNVLGSHNCSCKPGYVGTGRNCLGIVVCICCVLF